MMPDPKLSLATCLSVAINFSQVMSCKLGLVKELRNWGGGGSDWHIYSGLVELIYIEKSDGHYNSLWG